MSGAEARALMRREILAQPEVLAAAVEPLVERARGLGLDRARPLWMGGCGDGLFAAQALAGVFRAEGWDPRPASAAEMLWDARVRPGDGVVGVSISGGTRRTAEAMERATALGARTVAVTLDPESRLGRACGVVLPLPYEPISRSTPHSLDYTMTLLALAAIAGLDAPALQAAGGRDRRRGAGASGALTRHAILLPRRRSGVGLGRLRRGEAARGGGAARLGTRSGELVCHGANFMMRAGDVAVLCGGGGPADRRTLALEDGLGRLGLRTIRAGLDEAPLLNRPFAAARTVQALCLRGRGSRPRRGGPGRGVRSGGGAEGLVRMVVSLSPGPRRATSGPRLRHRRRSRCRSAARPPRRAARPGRCWRAATPPGA